MANPAAVALALLLLTTPTPSSSPPRLTWDAPTTLLSTYAGGRDSPPTPWDPLGDFGCRIANGNVFQLATGEPVPAPSRPKSGKGSADRHGDFPNLFFCQCSLEYGDGGLPCRA